MMLPQLLLITLSVLSRVYPMCLSPTWMEDANNRKLARRASIVAVGTVIKKPIHNSTHQKVSISIECVYKLDTGRIRNNKTKSVVEDELLNKRHTFLMQYFNNQCAPLLSNNSKYIFFFEVKGNKRAR